MPTTVLIVPLTFCRYILPLHFALQAKLEHLEHEKTVMKARGSKEKRQSAPEADRRSGSSSSHRSRALLTYGAERANLIDLVFDLFQTHEAQPFCAGVLSQLFLASCLKHNQKECRRRNPALHGKKKEKGFDLMSRWADKQDDTTTVQEDNRSRFLDGNIYDPAVHRMLFQRFVHMLPNVFSPPPNAKTKTRQQSQKSIQNTDAKLLLQMLRMIQNTIVLVGKVPSPPHPPPSPPLTVVVP